MTPDLHEPVGLEFRGRSRFLPILSLAAAFRRGAAEVARGLVVLIDGVDADPSDSDSAAGEGGMGGGVSGQEHSETKMSCSEQDKDKGVGGQGEGGTASDLLDEIVRGLGPDANRAALAKLIRSYPDSLVRDALGRTLAIPSERIRGSRSALFTGIVRTLARDAKRPTP